MKQMRSVLFWDVTQHLVVTTTIGPIFKDQAILIPSSRAQILNLRLSKYGSVLVTTARLTMFGPQMSSLTGTVLKILEIHPHKKPRKNCI